MRCIFTPAGHPEPSGRGAAAGPDQLLPQLHGAHQAAKEKVSCRPGSLRIAVTKTSRWNHT